MTYNEEQIQWKDRYSGCPPLVDKAPINTVNHYYYCCYCCCYYCCYCYCYYCCFFVIVDPLNASVETKIKIWRSKIPFMIVVIEMAMKVQRNKWQMK